MSWWVYIVAAWLIFVVAGTIWIRIRTRRIAASRPSENFDTFRSSFTGAEAQPEVLRAVYAKFQRWCSDAVAAFPVRAGDDIGRIYGMANEDLDDAVMEVIAECGRQLPPPDQLRQMRPVVTVRDFVLFVAACPCSAEHDRP